MTLEQLLGIVTIVRIGRWRLAWCRWANWRLHLNRYEAYRNWVSWQWGWLRLYRYHRDVQ